MLERAGYHVLALGMLVMICGACCRPASAPVARVNDITISRDELRQFIKLMDLCNPEASPQEGSAPPGRKEQELLHLLIGFELVNQAAAKAGIDVGPEEPDIKTEEILRALVETRYAGSLQTFHRKRRQLGLAPADLALLARYELQAEALFEQTVAGEADLLSLMEENPEMLHRPAAAELYRFRFTDGEAAREGLLRLQWGAVVEDIAAEGAGECFNLGWVGMDDPFIAKRVRQELLITPAAGSGCITASSEHYDLYWVHRVRPAEKLEFVEIKEEAALLQRCLLYEQFYYALWSESTIEIYLR